MKPPTAAEWRQIVRRRHKAKVDPFDGRPDQAGVLLALAMVLSEDPRGSRVVLSGTREVFGERTTRRYVPYLVDAALLEMVVKPTRAKNGNRGRVAVYEFRRGAVESLPGSPHEVGSENYDESGQRSCSTDDLDPEPVSAQSVPTSEREPSSLTTSAAVKFTTLTIKAPRLRPLASRRSDWPGWSCVAPRLTAPLAAAS